MGVSRGTGDPRVVSQTGVLFMKAEMAIVATIMRSKAIS